MNGYDNSSGIKVSDLKQAKQISNKPPKKKKKQAEKSPNSSDIDISTKQQARTVQATSLAENLNLAHELIQPDTQNKTEE